MKASIIASGASLKGFDLNSIEGYKLVLNHVYKYVDEYDGIVCFDSPNIVKIPQELEHKTHTLAEHNFGIGYELGTPHGFERREGWVVQINATLFMAINIALLEGYKEIDVYGADMALTDGFVHFYDEKKADPKMIAHYERRFKKNKKEWELLSKSLLSDEKVAFVDVRNNP